MSYYPPIYSQPIATASAGWWNQFLGGEHQRGIFGFTDIKIICVEPTCRGLLQLKLQTGWAFWDGEKQEACLPFDILLEYCPCTLYCYSSNILDIAPQRRIYMYWNGRGEQTCMKYENIVQEYNNVREQYCSLRAILIHLYSNRESVNRANKFVLFNLVSVYLKILTDLSLLSKLIWIQFL